MSKEKVAQQIVSMFKSGQRIGVGTGSTVVLALNALAERIKNEKLEIEAVVTSHQSEWQCQQMGVTVLAAGYQGELDWGFDGADEIDSKLRVIKGRGGAMLREKLVAARCRKFIIIADDSKMVAQLGSTKPVPVEVLPQALSLATAGLKKLGATEITLRPCAGGKEGPVITELGNVILDARFSSISDSLEREIKQIDGVVESGLFIGRVQEALIAGADGVRVMHAA